MPKFFHREKTASKRPDIDTGPESINLFRKDLKKLLPYAAKNDSPWRLKDRQRGLLNALSGYRVVVQSAKTSQIDEVCGLLMSVKQHLVHLLEGKPEADRKSIIELFWKRAEDQIGVLPCEQWIALGKRFSEEAEDPWRFLIFGEQIRKKTMQAQAKEQQSSIKPTSSSTAVMKARMGTGGTGQTPVQKVLWPAAKKKALKKYREGLKQRTKDAQQTLKSSNSILDQIVEINEQLSGATWRDDAFLRLKHNFEQAYNLFNDCNVAVVTAREEGSIKPKQSEQKAQELNHRGRAAIEAGERALSYPRKCLLDVREKLKERCQRITEFLKQLNSQKEGVDQEAYQKFNSQWMPFLERLRQNGLFQDEVPTALNEVVTTIKALRLLSQPVIKMRQQLKGYCTLLFERDALIRQHRDQQRLQREHKAEVKKCKSQLKNPAKECSLGVDEFHRNLCSHIDTCIKGCYAEYNQQCSVLSGGNKVSSSQELLARDPEQEDRPSGVRKFFEVLLACFGLRKRRLESSAKREKYIRNAKAAQNLKKKWQSYFNVDNPVEQLDGFQQKDFTTALESYWGNYEIGTLWEGYRRVQYFNFAEWVQGVQASEKEQLAGIKATKGEIERLEQQIQRNREERKAFCEQFSTSTAPEASVPSVSDVRYKSPRVAGAAV
jgi:hypothetical protein